jgi:hypothetical protein
MEEMGSRKEKILDSRLRGNDGIENIVGVLSYIPIILNPNRDEYVENLWSAPYP